MLKIKVLAKQVPDTANITGNAMKDDGTVNRAILPAVFNPEDLNALELALSIKDTVGDCEVSVISMGPAKAVDVLKHSLFMGADKVYLISDRKYAGADTLATSFVLSEAIKLLGGADIVLAGRQAIDGDTAQVGPQVAEKLDMNQITYVSGIREITGSYAIVERDGEYQTEIIKAHYPVLMTVTSSVNMPRYPNASKMLRHFKSDIPSAFTAEKLEDAQKSGRIIPLITNDDLKLDDERCGLKGSPTKVHNIKSITLTGGDLKFYGNENEGIKSLIRDIMKDYVEVES
ncbi:MAG TPA: electron transfer flavoprotein subunit beta/FixA family protein [bacterium]|nr:electron transfer flavoprotein subunit beta/FixA family protein [bacterium]HPS29677.1 electron transfer flavoprotein subunit beta/FixA family protein [bacterium]